MTLQYRKKAVIFPSFVEMMLGWWTALDAHMLTFSEDAGGVYWQTVHVWLLSSLVAFGYIDLHEKITM